MLACANGTGSLIALKNGATPEYGIIDVRHKMA